MVVDVEVKILAEYANATIIPIICALVERILLALVVREDVTMRLITANDPHTVAILCGKFTTFCFFLFFCFFY